jgi:uncharacterized protein YutE (UPF0331/DUF86 family)
MILNRGVSIVLIDPSRIPYLKQIDLQEVMARALGLEGTWFKGLFERISVETLVESFFGNYVHYEDVSGLLEHMDLLRLLNPFQPYVDLFSHFALFLEASSLRDRIVLCHDKLADALISLLRRRGLEVSKVDRALRAARELNIISESEYKLLEKFNELRGRAHHGTYLSRYNEKIPDTLKREVEEAKNLVVKLSTIEAKSWFLRELAECLKKPPDFNLVLIALTN